MGFVFQVPNAGLPMIGYYFNISAKERHDLPGISH